MTMHRESIITAAKAQADADCQRAIVAGMNAHLGPEYVVSGDATGKRLLIPARALAVGMLDFLTAAYARNHDQSDAA